MTLGLNKENICNLSALYINERDMFCIMQQLINILDNIDTYVM
jgi:hypothetical protein